MNKNVITQWLEFLLFSLGVALLSYLAFTAVDAEAVRLWRSWTLQRPTSQATHISQPRMR